MNNLINRNTEAVTMTSLEIAELVDVIESGVASKSLAYEHGMKCVAYACELVGSCNYSDVENLDREQAKIELEKIYEARTFLKVIESMFVHYPTVILTMRNLEKTIALAEAFLIPIFMLRRKVAKRSNKNVFTYFVRHPKTKLIKIGKTIDVESRIKSLECGSGGKLHILAVLNGNKERELHKKFSNSRVHGEWFSDKDKVITNYIDSALEVI